MPKHQPPLASFSVRFGTLNPETSRRYFFTYFLTAFGPTSAP
jgi:hypothetical protein